MPYTFSFSKKNQRFDKHYSGGNGTRIGMFSMFSMFYSLFGNYWPQVLKEQKSPVLFDVLHEQNYQMRLFTSAKFTYPEFTKTIFSSIPKKNLHENFNGLGWEDDRENVDLIIDFIDNRDKQAPFMTFMFFESPHARYYFPKESVIEENYLHNFNYLTTDINQHIQQIKNRYINSVHHLDSQLQRILEHAKNSGLLENTIIIITGDHGEEFLEKGKWGHNSTFSEEQIRVPLVLHIPGKDASIFSHRTNHIDIIPTILPLLGVTNQTTDYALGQSLFNTNEAQFMVLSDWDSNTIITDSFKQTLPAKAQGIFRNNSILNNKDEVIENYEKGEEYQAALSGAFKMMRTFLH